MKKLLVLTVLWCLAIAAHAEKRFTVVTIDSRQQRLEVFLKDEAGQPLKRFARLAAWQQEHGKRLAFAVNAGMYHADFSPVGLLVQNGKQTAPLNLADGTGNFFMKPNGVFLISAAGPQVVESTEYPSVSGEVRIATQSGPLLLRNGVMHPAFRADSASRHIRNGVGVVGSKVLLVISDEPVTFYELATFFRETLGCRDALYLDGAISSLYSEKLKRHEARADLGPILFVSR